MKIYGPGQDSKLGNVIAHVDRNGDLWLESVFFGEGERRSKWYQRARSIDSEALTEIIRGIGRVLGSGLSAIPEDDCMRLQDALFDELAKR